VFALSLHIKSTDSIIAHEQIVTWKCVRTSNVSFHYGILGIILQFVDALTPTCDVLSHFQRTYVFSMLHLHVPSDQSIKIMIYHRV